MTHSAVFIFGGITDGSVLDAFLMNAHMSTFILKGQQLSEPSTIFWRIAETAHRHRPWIFGHVHFHGDAITVWYIVWGLSSVQVAKENFPITIESPSCVFRTTEMVNTKAVC
jgi:hypothetical protein